MCWHQARYTVHGIGAKTWTFDASKKVEQCDPLWLVLLDCLINKVKERQLDCPWHPLIRLQGLREI